MRRIEGSLTTTRVAKSQLTFSSEIPEVFSHDNTIVAKNDRLMDFSSTQEASGNAEAAFG